MESVFSERCEKKKAGGDRRSRVARFAIAPHRFARNIVPDRATSLEPLNTVALYLRAVPEAEQRSRPLCFPLQDRQGTHSCIEKLGPGWNAAAQHELDLQTRQKGD